MKKIPFIFSLVAFSLFVASAVLGQAANSANVGCNNLWWVDDNSRVCQQKQFCGAYMYLGLKTFQTKNECENYILASFGSGQSGAGTGSVVCPSYTPPRCAEGEVLVAQNGTDENGCPKPSKCVKKAGNVAVKCGDGICQNITCAATNCPPAENEENCPQDCKNACRDGASKNYKCPDGKEVLGWQCYGGQWVSIKYLIDPCSKPVNADCVAEGKTGTRHENEKENCCLGLIAQPYAQTGSKPILILYKCVKSGPAAKVMPSTASQRAIERLGQIKDVQIELREKKANDPESNYGIAGKKEGKLFGFLKIAMPVSAEVGADSGAVKSTKKPWWSFLVW